MAVSANTQWEVRTGGSDTNGGGFNSAGSGADLTLQNGAAYSVTDGVTAGTTTVTSATANWGTNVVGNLAYIQGGTGAVVAGWYEITARPSTTTLTVDRSTGLTPGTAVTINVGGALASPGGAAGALSVTGVGLAGQIVNIKSGTYVIGSGTPNTGGNRVATSVAGIIWWGYQNTRRDGGTKPILQVGSNSINLMVFSNFDTSAINLEFLGGGGFTLVGGLALGNGRCIARDCKASGFDNGGFLGSGASVAFIGCEASGITGGSAAITATGDGARFVGCSAHGCSVPGIKLPNASSAVRCLSYANSSSGFQATTGCNLTGCTSYGNTGGAKHGFDLQTGTGVYCHSCVAVNNGTSGSSYGFSIAGPGWAYLFDCAGFGNLSGNTNGPYLDNLAFQTLSADPFVAASSGNFALNNVNGGGKLMRAAGYPQSWPGNASASFPDIGAVQGRASGPPAIIRSIMVLGSNRRGQAMAVNLRPGGTYWGEFVTADTTGAAVNADSLPVATANHNGTDDGTFTLTVTNVDTGRYKFTGTIPSGYAVGDSVAMSIAATIGGIGAKNVVDLFTVSTSVAGIGF